MDPKLEIQQPARLQAAKLAPRLQEAISNAKAIAQRQVSAVQQDALNATYRQSTPPEAQVPGNTHLQLAIDDGTGRVIGRIVDADSGELVTQIPSEEMLRLIALTKELFGDLVNEKV